MIVRGPSEEPPAPSPQTLASRRLEDGRQGLDEVGRGRSRVSVCVLCVAGLRVSVSTPAPRLAVRERSCAHRSLSVCLSVRPSGCSGRFLSTGGNLTLGLQCFWWLQSSILSFLLVASLS